MTTPSSERNPVELLAEEFLERYRRGENPELAAYIRQYPEHADEIRELFPVLLELEQALPDETDRSQAKVGTSHPEQVGDYRIVREIGRGGMGIVYEAEQQSLGRSVALKVLPAQNNHDELALERFRREARAAAKLHHTNIVPVFDVGQEGTTSYYAMQFIQGQPFDTVIRELRRQTASGGAPAPDLLSPVMAAPVTEISGSLEDGQPVSTTSPPSHAQTATTVVTATNRSPERPCDPVMSEPTAENVSSDNTDSSSDADQRSYFQSVASVAHQVSQALAYAHARGVVHRDIKPSNLLLDTNGVAWVTDFGMAKTDAEPLTRTGDILGTIHYMAPERFQGQCDSRADIYAAGLTVYELLTLTPAFESTDRLHLVELIAKHDPPRPRTVNPRIPRDLETIVLKAIDKDPQRRYQTAAELAEDFECFLEDRPIRTRRLGLTERFVRWARRNPLLAGLSVAIALLLLLALVGATGSAVVLKRTTDRAIEAEQASEAKAEQLLQQSYINWVNLAYLECRNDNVARAQEYLENCPPAQRGWEWQFVAGQCQVALRSMKEFGHSVNCLDFSPDGRLLAIGTGNFLNRHGPPGDLVVRDVWTGKAKFSQRGLANGVTAVAFSPDGSQIAVANSNRLTVLDVATGAKLFAKEGGSRDLLCLAFSPDGRRIAGGFGLFNVNHAGHVTLWDATTGDEVGDRIPGHAGGVWDLAFDPSGTRLALTSEDRVDVWDLGARELVAELVADVGFIYGVAYHPNGRYVAAGGWDRKIRLWDINRGELARTYIGHTGFVRGVAFSADGQRIVSASEDKTLRLWDIDSERELAAFRGHTHFVNCVSFSADGRIVASGSLDQSVKVWFAAGENQLVYKGHVEEGHVRALAFSPDGNALASGSLRFSGPTGRLHLWDANTGERILQFPRNVEEVSSVVFRQDGERLAAGHVSGIVTVWNATTADLLFRLDAHVSEVYDVAYSPDGSLLASVGEDMGVNIWNADTGVLLRTGMGHEAFVTSVEFSPDGQTIATASEDGTVRLWDPTTARQLWTVKHSSGEARSVAYSPDGLRLVSTGGIDHRRGDVLIWDAKSGRQLSNLRGHTDIVYDVDFSPDGQRFATASDDRTIKLWDAESEREVFTIRGHTGGVVSVEFSPDGRQIASGGVDRTVRVWSLTPPGADVHFRREAVTEYSRGQAMLQQARWGDAIMAFTRAAELGFERVPLRLSLATALRNEIGLDAANEHINKAVGSAPDDGHVLARLGLELASRGYFTPASRAMDRAVSLSPEDSMILSAAGRLHAVIGQIEQSEQCFKRVIEIQAELAAPEAWWWETGWWSAGPMASSSSEEDAQKRIRSPIQQIVTNKPNASGPADEVSWTTVPADGDGYLDIYQPSNEGSKEEQFSTYAIQHVYASTEQSVVFLVGTGDGLRLWLNGELVFAQSQGQLDIGHRAISVTLQPGWNTVLARLANRGGWHGMYFHVSNHARDRARGAARNSQWDQVLEIWSGTSESERDDIHLLEIVGNAHARRGQWDEAATVYERLIERQPSRNRNWVSLAPLLVHTGSLERYGRYRHDLLALFGHAANAITAERTSKASLLIPVSTTEAALPHKLASEAVVLGANHGLLPYFLFAKGMSAYRIGDFRLAIDTLEQSLAGNRSRWPYLDVVIYVYLAMSHHQLEEYAVAHQQFDKANAIFAERLPAADSTDFGADWLDWLICEIARTEARQLLSAGEKSLGGAK